MKDAGSIYNKCLDGQVGSTEPSTSIKSVCSEYVGKKKSLGKVNRGSKECEQKRQQNQSRFERAGACTMICTRM